MLCGIRQVDGPRMRNCATQHDRLGEDEASLSIRDTGPLGILVSRKLVETPYSLYCRPRLPRSRGNARIVFKAGMFDAKQWSGSLLR